MNKHFLAALLILLASCATTAKIIPHCALQKVNARVCTLCDKSFVLTSSRQCAESKIPHCDRASDSGDTCLRCEKGFYLKGSQCHAQSIPGRLRYDRNQNTCSQVEIGQKAESSRLLAASTIPFCELPQNTQQCTKCSAGYYLTSNRLCKAQSIDGCAVYIPNRNACQTCQNNAYLNGTLCSKFLDANCKTQVSNKNACGVCNSLFYPNPRGVCVRISDSTCQGSDGLRNVCRCPQSRKFCPADGGCKVPPVCADNSFIVDCVANQCVCPPETVLCETCQSTDKCVKFLSNFGGIYQNDDCNVTSLSNPFTNGLNCPTGFNYYHLGRIKTPEGSRCGANTFGCLSSSREHLGFGGMYQVDDCQRNNVANALTGALSCPAGMQSYHFGRVLAPESRCGANQFFCAGSLSNAVQFGGTYQLEDYGRHGPANPVTGGFDCPAGFSVAPYGRIFHPEHNTGSTQFFCFKRYD